MMFAFNNWLTQNMTINSHKLDEAVPAHRCP